MTILELNNIPGRRFRRQRSVFPCLFAESGISANLAVDGISASVFPPEQETQSRTSRSSEHRESKADPHSFPIVRSLS